MAAVEIRIRRDTEANWLLANPVLASGEPTVAWKPDGTSYMRVGDGVRVWSELPDSKGEKGDKGDPGTVTPEMIALRAESVAAKDAAEAAKRDAEAAAEEAATGAASDASVSGLIRAPGTQSRAESARVSAIVSIPLVLAEMEAAGFVVRQPEYGTQVSRLTGQVSQTPLTTPTYDGTGSSVHPSVVHVPGGWNGYEYWMGHTPYHNQDITKENPSILASHDGIMWVLPVGCPDPVVPHPGGTAYNNDPALALKDGKMYMFFRAVVGNQTTLHGAALAAGSEAIFLVTSLDGTTWTAPELQFSTLTDTFRNLSPAVVVEADGTWSMYTVNSNAKQIRVRKAPSPGFQKWGAAGVVEATMATIQGGGRYPWHVDVKRDGADYWLLINDTAPNTSGVMGELYMCHSRDGVNFNVPMVSTIARERTGPNSYLYRASFEVLPDRSMGYRFRVWYSTKSGGVDGQRIFHTTIQGVAPTKDELSRGPRRSVLIPSVYGAGEWILGDDFSRPDGPVGIAPTGQAWRTDTGGWTISGGVAVPTASPAARMSVDLGVTDFEAEATFNTSATGYSYLMARYADISNYMRIGFAGLSVTFTRFVAGANVDIRPAYTQVSGGSNRLSVKCSGSTYTVRLNGDAIAVFDVNALIANTRVGLQGSGTGNSATSVSVRRVL